MVLLLLSLPFLLALLVAMPLPKTLRAYQAWGVSTAMAGLFGYWLTRYPAQPIFYQWSWVPTLGVDLSFYLDGLSWLFLLLVTGIGALVCLYAGGYLHDDPKLGRFYAYLLLFIGAMQGLVLSSNLLLLFLFWELTSISSFLLIGWKHKKESSRHAARTALAVTGTGGLILLAGLLLLGQITGTWEVRELLGQSAETIAQHPLYPLTLLLIALAAFTKSAQVPFHFWLPGAMEAPTPVSAYLHSATMVKAGIFLLARLTPVLGHSDLWLYLLTTVGAVTLLVGAWLSWQNDDLKLILAYTTIAALGALTLLIGLSYQLPIARKAFFLFLLAHALYKGALFMLAGAVDHATGTREIGLLGGLRHKMPLTFFSTLLACASMIGLPLLVGFVSKELFYEAITHLDRPLWLALLLAGVLGNAMMATSAALLMIRPFFGRTLRAPHPDHVHEAPLTMSSGPLVLTTLSLLFGCAPFLLDQFGRLFVASLGGEQDKVYFAIWHGFHLITEGRPSPLLLTFITLALAALLYVVRDRLKPLVLPLRGDNWGAHTLYNSSLDAVLRGGERLTVWFSSFSLKTVLAIIFSVASATLLFTLFSRTSGWLIPLPPAIPQPHELILSLLAIFGAIWATQAKTRYHAIMALGLVGFIITMFFALYSAPDLAMTQFAIELLSVILIALILWRLPDFTPSSRFQRLATSVVSLFVGVTMTFTVWAVLSVPLQSQLTDFFMENSYVIANGRNVVNVILVDFRGFDTYGEVTVLAIAALGVYALSRLYGKKQGGAKTSSADFPDLYHIEHSLILETSTRYLLPLLLLFSVFVILRGHNEPGGGFVGGLIAAAAFALYTFAFGTRATRDRLRFDPLHIVAFGLSCTFISGVLSFGRQTPFMTAIWTKTPLPAIGKLSTPLLFDSGVYFIVLGVVLIIILNLFELEKEV